MTTTTKEIGRFLAKAEERTIGKFMDIAGLGKEYQSAKSIPEIKSVLKEFDERGYSIESKKVLNRIDEKAIMWRISLSLDSKEIASQDIKVTITL